MKKTYIRDSLLMNHKSNIPINTPFKTTWNMTSGSFTLLTQTGTYNAIINWGDGKTSSHTTGNPTHTYTSSGKYQISISGSYSGLRISLDATQKDKLASIDDWGNVGFTSFENAFANCTYLSKLPEGPITGAENVTNFQGCFYSCTSLPSIPNNLLDNCINATNFQGCFNNLTSGNFTSIPKDLFKYNINATTFNACFANCGYLTSIPTDLFKYNINATIFNQCFCNCINLTSIPTGIFDNCINATSFPQCFSGCTKLTTLSTNLFNSCINVTDFTRCFENCSSLRTLPNDLFTYNVNVINFSYCFKGCRNIALPTTIFNLTALQTKQPIITQCFNVDSTSYSHTGTIQPIWNYITTPTQCFWSCTSLTNYASIPTNWKS